MNEALVASLGSSRLSKRDTRTFCNTIQLLP